MGDDRFASLFSNADFQIDVDSLEYRLRHPAAPNSQGASDLLQDKFALVDAEEEEEEGRESGDSDDDVLELVSGRKLFEDPEAERKKEEAIRAKRKARTARKPKMLEVKTGEQLKPMTSLSEATATRVNQQKKSFGSLVKKAATKPKTRIQHTAAGGKIITVAVSQISGLNYGLAQFMVFVFCLDKAGCERRVKVS